MLRHQDQYDIILPHGTDKVYEHEKDFNAERVKGKHIASYTT